MSLETAIHADAESAAEAAVDRLEEWGRAALEERGRWVLSLAGGRTPEAVYRRWGEVTTLAWRDIALLYGDERCVPPHHPDSNHGMVAGALLARLAVPPRVYPMAGEHADPERAARDYEAVLEEVLGPDGAIDIALLGIGTDGHTASLFPGSPALGESSRRCVATRAPDGRPRLTLTLAELRRARRRVFLAVGEGKREILRRVVLGDADPVRYPAQALLRDETLETHLICDREAGAGLQ